jgi:hypothetical protein
LEKVIQGESKEETIDQEGIGNDVTLTREGNKIHVDYKGGMEKDFDIIFTPKHIGVD